MPNLLLHFLYPFLQHQHLPPNIILIIPQVVHILLQPHIQCLIVLYRLIHSFLKLIQIINKYSLDILQVTLNLIIGLFILCYDLLYMLAWLHRMFLNLMLCLSLSGGTRFRGCLVSSGCLGWISWFGGIGMSALFFKFCLVSLYFIYDIIFMKYMSVIDSKIVTDYKIEYISIFVGILSRSIQQSHPHPHIL